MVTYHYVKCYVSIIIHLEVNQVTNIYILQQHILYSNVEFYFVEMSSLQQGRPLCVEWANLVEFLH
jgi:hypothetical protein